MSLYSFGTTHAAFVLVQAKHYAAKHGIDFHAALDALEMSADTATIVAATWALHTSDLYVSGVYRDGAQRAIEYALLPPTDERTSPIVERRIGGSARIMFCLRARQ